MAAIASIDTRYLEDTYKTRDVNCGPAVTRLHTHFRSHPLRYFLLSGYNCHSAQNTYLTITLFFNSNTIRCTLFVPHSYKSSYLQTFDKTQRHPCIVACIKAGRVIDLICLVLGYCSATRNRRQTTESCCALALPLPLQAQTHILLHTRTHRLAYNPLQFSDAPPTTPSRPISMRSQSRMLITL
jgi:hypothetical protein